MAKYREDLDLEAIKAYYQHPQIQAALVNLAQNKEMVGSYGGTGYAKRPDTLYYEQDVKALVAKGVTSFHFSEETWEDPDRLVTGMPKIEQNNLRLGWDLVIDIDCSFFEYSKLAAHLVVQFFKSYDIQAISVKFSGNHGFHIAVPFESMPAYINGKETRTLFPEAARLVAELLKEKIESSKEPGKLSAAILDYELNHLGFDEKTHASMQQVIHEIAKKTDMPFEKITRKRTDSNGYEVIDFSAFSLLEIDTILISSRHLCRATYAVNEKSGLVSIPINPDKILLFEKKVASMDNLKHFTFRFKFLDRDHAIPGEATRLLTESYDFATQQKSVTDSQQPTVKREFEQITDKIPEMYFPPMIEKLLAGNLIDGKKRGLFILAAFLCNVGWPQADAHKRILEWNATHPEQLRDTYINGQLRHVYQSKTLPPNFATIADYFNYPKSEIPTNFKNPLAYAKSKYSFAVGKESTREKLTDEQKQMRKAHREKLKALDKLG